MGESRLTKRDCKFLSTLITECWKVCKKDGKRNLAPFMEKCNHLRKYLLAMCKQVNESSGRSFLTKIDFGKIMKLVMEYAWNAWDIGQLHYDWKEAEFDGHRKLVEDYLQSLCVEQVDEGFFDSLRKWGGNLKDTLDGGLKQNEGVKLIDQDGKKWNGKVVEFNSDLDGWAIVVNGEANESTDEENDEMCKMALRFQPGSIEDLKKEPKGEIPSSMKKVGSELTLQRKTSAAYKMKVINIKNMGDGLGQIIMKTEKRLGRANEGDEADAPVQANGDKITEIEPTGDVDQDFNNAMTALRDDNYETFIADLNTLASDPKIAHLRDAIIEKFNSPDGLSVEFSGNVAMPIRNIHPTQFEVDMEKSLAYPLKKKPEGIKVAFSGKPVLIANTPLVVAEVDGVNYIIDGHHRWSQVYCLNPEAQMVVRIIKSKELFKDADDVLKLVQMQLFIAKDGGELPQATVDSEYNLYTIDENNFKKWVDSTITDEATQLFAQFIEGQKPSDYLWNNVLTMRKEAQPTKNAHGRGDMPQTDQVSGEFMKPKAQPLSESEMLDKPMKSDKDIFLMTLMRLVSIYGERCYTSQLDGQDDVDENTMFEQNVKLQNTIMATSMDDGKCRELMEKVIDYGGQMISLGILKSSGSDMEDDKVCELEADKKYQQVEEFASDIFQPNN